MSRQRQDQVESGAGMTMRTDIGMEMAAEMDMGVELAIIAIAAVRRVTTTSRGMRICQ